MVLRPTGSPASPTLHPAYAVANIRHLEYFADHTRLERILFDG